MKVSDNRAGDFEPFDQKFPGMFAPVVRKAEDGERELLELSWGFVLLQKGKAPRRVQNTRSEKTGSPFWAASVRERRCLVPVTSFCEPLGRSPAVYHWFALAEERPLFAFAGIWRSWRGPIKKDGETVEIDTFSFLTTKPNELVAPIHDRMPVILADEAAQDQWIDGSEAEAKALLRPFPAERMVIVQKGADKRDLAPLEDAA